MYNERINGYGIKRSIKIDKGDIRVNGYLAFLILNLGLASNVYSVEDFLD